MQAELFPEDRARIALGPGAVLLGGFALAVADTLIAQIEAMARDTPLRHMETRGGHRMSVAMFNCGALGWVSDRSGYRYDPVDPESGKRWPEMPRAFRDVARSAVDIAGYPRFTPDACLVNCYRPGTQLSLHRDQDERDRTAPIVSVSLGRPATFLWGGLARNDAQSRHTVLHGDVVVWGGPSRFVYHGVQRLQDGWHEATGALRYNLTFRKVV